MYERSSKEVEKALRKKVVVAIMLKAHAKKPEDIVTTVTAIHEAGLFPEGEGGGQHHQASAILALGVATRTQLQYWRNGRVLFERALAVVVCDQDRAAHRGS